MDINVREPTNKEKIKECWDYIGKGFHDDIEMDERIKVWIGRDGEAHWKVIKRKPRRRFRR